MFERSPIAIASMIAVWKAGGAYVPINPEAAHVQFSHILEDAGIKYLLVHDPTESVVRRLCEGKIAFTVT